MQPREYSRPPSRVTTEELFDLLIGVDTPQIVLFDPAFEILAGNAAPGAVAGFDRSHHPSLEFRGDRALGVGFRVQHGEISLHFELHRRRTFARQQRMIDPALGPIRIADAAPILELGGDFDRPSDAGEDERDVVVLVRTASDIDAIRFDADKTRHGQPAWCGVTGRMQWGDGRRVR